MWYNAMFLDSVTKFDRRRFVGFRWSILKRWMSENRRGSGMSDADLSRTRNIGLVAHIDAGKTTTTERWLYYSGCSDHLGEVHHGDTVMDYMIQERERGITIQMAAATIRWRRHSLNLIDTPGHVDFTFEVERSLSVLDGAVVILDASAGVQAQTIKVWQQASKYRLPAIIYLNKMDKPAASVQRCLTAVAEKLRREPLLLQKPWFESGSFSGIVDLVDGVGLRFKDHQITQIEDLRPEDIHADREKLIERLADLDESFGDHVLSLPSVMEADPEVIRAAIRTLTLRREIAPVVLGSSYRNIGVQPLLDAVCYYLPNPLETERSRELFEYYRHREHNLCALAFKIHHHQRLGMLCYVRLYSGMLTPGQLVYNPLRETGEKIARIYRPFADSFREVSKADPPVRVGDIVAVSGLTATVTGDTLVQPGANQVHKELLFAGIEIPEPVYYCSLECDSISKMKVLEQALQNIQREDPSLRVVVDRNTQQLVIQGMGQLHIEIIKDRIKREYNVDVETGPLQISYKETITGTGRATVEQSKSIGGSMNHARITISVEPEVEEDRSLFGRKSSSHPVTVKIINTKEQNLAAELKPHQLKAIQNGIAKALQYGPLYSFPVTGVQPALHAFETSAPRSTTAAYVANVSGQCTLQALRQAEPVLMEPIMMVEIVTPEPYVGPILSDLSARRAIFGDPTAEEKQEDKDDSNDNRERHLLAYVPLAEMADYCTTLRRITSGMASFDMRLHSYRRMDGETSARIIRELSGIAA